MSQVPRFRSKTDRNLMALALAMDPTLAPTLRRFLRMGVRNIRSDYMLFPKPNGAAESVPDPGAWSGDISPKVGVMLLRSPNGEWWMNGF